MTQRYYLVDGNSVGYVAHQSSAQLKAGNQPTSAIYGSIQTLRDIIVKFGHAKVVVVWDGRSWRKDVSAVYKANREASPEQVASREAYKTQTPHLKEIYRHLGVSQISAANMEADDLAAIFSHQWSIKGHIVKLITRDKDWLQLVRPNVQWYDHKTAEIVTEKSFKEVTGFQTPKQFSQFKALQGDPSDNLPGVGGIGEVKARELLDTYGNVEAFFNWPANPAGGNVGLVWSGTVPKAIREFHADPERRKRFVENMRLMDLTCTKHFPPPIDLKLDVGVFDQAKVREKFVELGFHTLLAKLDKFTHPFKAPGETHALAS